MSKLTHFFKPAENKTLNKSSSSSSLSSLSSLSTITSTARAQKESVLPSSQDDFPTSSSTAISAGYVPDSEGDDSDFDLVDFFKKPDPPKKEPKHVKLLTENHELDLDDLPNASPITLSAKRKTRGSQASLPEKVIKKKGSYKPSGGFSLDDLLAQREKQRAREYEIERADKLMKRLQEEDERANRSNDSIRDPNDSTFGIAAGGDRKQAKTLAETVLDNTAWRVDGTWSFFDETTTSRRKSSIGFPTKDLGKESGWLSQLNSKSVRDCFFTCGFVADMLRDSRYSISDDFLSWLVEQVSVETNQDLLLAYVSVLETIDQKLEHILTPSRIKSLFHNLGGSTQALDITNEVTLENKVKKKKKKAFEITDECYVNIHYCLKLLTAVTRSLTTEATITALCLVLRLSFDDKIYKDGRLLLTINAALSSMLSSSHETRWVQLSSGLLETLYKMFPTPTLRLRLLNSLPVTTVQQATFRRKLATMYLFEDSHLEISEDFNVKKFITRIHEQPFKISLNTDYVQVQNIINILDIALDDASPLEQTEAVNNLKLEQELESLCNRLKILDDKIVDGMAVDLTRTDAKDALERVHLRIQNTLRQRHAGKQQTIIDMHFRDERDASYVELGELVTTSKA